MPIYDALPVLGPGESPPGRFEADEEWYGFKRWRGPLGWLTRHGSGTLQWSLGRPVRAVGAVLPDGSVAGDIETLSPVDRDTWRRPDPNGPGFQLGQLSMETDALVFTPIPRPPPTAGETNPDDAADMWSELAGDPAFMTALADRAFAEAVYDAFRGVDFRRGEQLAVFSMSYREAGARLSMLRGVGEAYTDFFDWTPAAPPAMAARVSDIFLALGWHEVGPAEAADLRATAGFLAVTYAARPSAPQPDWAPDAGRRSSPETTGPQAGSEEEADLADDEDDALRALLRRIDELARSGRLTRREWLALRSLGLCL